MIADGDDTGWTWPRSSGCTDAEACNYDSAATEDDGSCADDWTNAECAAATASLKATCDCDGNGPAAGYALGDVRMVHVLQTAMKTVFVTMQKYWVDG